MPRLAASVELMFQEVSLLDRFAQAAAAGFRGVEIQSPYGAAKEDVAERVRRHGLEAVLMNVLPAVADCGRLHQDDNLAPDLGPAHALGAP